MKSFNIIGAKCELFPSGLSWRNYECYKAHSLPQPIKRNLEIRKDIILRKIYPYFDLKFFLLWLIKKCDQ